MRRLACLLLAACPDPKPSPCGDQPCCVEENDKPRCIEFNDCLGNHECPSGFECSGHPGEVAFPDRFSTCKEDKYGNFACQIPDEFTPLAENALVGGFGVPRFDLIATTASTADGDRVSFTWTQPEKATVVKCALFGCEPKVHQVDQNGYYNLECLAFEAGNTPLLPERLEIVNYDRCAIADDVFEGGGIFQPRTRRSPPSRQSPLYTTLAAGCWALDGTQVIAATELEPVDANTLPDDVGKLARRCPVSSSVPEACPLPGLENRPFLGSCEGGSCRHRCLSQADCDRALNPVGMRLFECVPHSELETLGLCLPVSP